MVRGSSMPEDGRPSHLRSRRAFLALAGSSWCFAQRTTVHAEVLPSDAKRYYDPATEFTVVRLTDPAYSSYLTAAYNRGFGRSFLLFSNDRGGKFDVYRMDVKSGQSRRLTEAEHLDPASVALLSGDREFTYIDGASLHILNLTAQREREVYSAAAPFDQLAAVAVMPGSGGLCVIERGNGRSRIRIVSLARTAAAETLVESDEEIATPAPRPGGGVAFRCGSKVCFSGKPAEMRPLGLAGRVGPMYWAADGSSLLYLSISETPGQLNSIREYVLATGQDRLVAKTSQFVQLAPNGDASVFVGASGSKASPHVLILLRSSKRELTLCEHRVSDPRNLSVVFSPNSQRIVFQSDQHGKPALYTIAVERFVSETETE